MVTQTVYISLDRFYKLEFSVTEFSNRLEVGNYNTYNQYEVMIVAKVKLPYKVGNRLGQYIQSYARNNSIKIQDAETILAKYCNVSIETIKGIKKGKNQCSVPVGLMISRFMNVPFDDIFYLVEGEEDANE